MQQPETSDANDEHTCIGQIITQGTCPARRRKLPIVRLEINVTHSRVAIYQTDRVSA